MSQLSEEESYAKMQPVLVADEIVKARIAIARVEFLLLGCDGEEDRRGYELELVERYTFIRIATRALAAEKKRRRRAR
jgi:hypothetical protein